MTFLRPELALALQRRRESLVWAVTLAVGLALMWRGYARVEPLVFTAGLGASLVGLALLRGARARLRLGSAAAAPGVVVIDEGRIGLFGPQGGGFVDLAALVAVEVADGPVRTWVLYAEDGAVLRVPFGATGAERIPDALAALPGLDLATADRDGPLWRREDVPPGALPGGRALGLSRGE